MSAKNRPTPPYEHCTRPIATAPRDGGFIWIERKPHRKTGKPLLRPITRVRWRKAPLLPSGGRWQLVDESECSLQDDNIVGWETAFR